MYSSQKKFRFKEKREIIRERKSKSKIKKESVTEHVCALTLILSDSRLT